MECNRGVCGRTSPLGCLRHVEFVVDLGRLLLRPESVREKVFCFRCMTLSSEHRVQLQELFGLEHLIQIQIQHIGFRKPIHQTLKYDIPKKNEKKQKLREYWFEYILSEPILGVKDDPHDEH